MNICLLIWNISNKGGEERVACNLANNFFKKHNITIVSCFSNNNNRIAYNLNSDIKPVVFLVPEGQRWRYCFFNSYHKIRKHLKQNNCQIVVCIGVATAIFLPAMLGLGISKIVCEHSNLKNKFFTSGFWHKLQRVLIRLFADKIITLTDQDAKCYQQIYHFSSSKTTHIYNWIEPDIKKIFNQSNIDSNKILTLGRFDPVKGYDYLIQVGQVLMGFTDNWEWHIYGQDTANIKAQLIKQIKECKLENHVFLHEAVNDIKPLFQTAALFALTSIYEGLPMALLEAKGYGFPLVAFDCPTGPSEIITDNVNGYLIECYDCEIMAKKIAELLNNPEIRMEFSIQSQFDIQRFSMETILQQWEQLFEEFALLYK